MRNGARLRDDAQPAWPETRGEATKCFVNCLRGHEGVVLARTFWHSVILTIALGVLVALQQFVSPGMIPSH